jgi:hypothetical protein
MTRQLWPDAPSGAIAVCFYRFLNTSWGMVVYRMPSGILVNPDNLHPWTPGDEYTLEDETELEPVS